MLLNADCAVWKFFAMMSFGTWASQSVNYGRVFISSSLSRNDIPTDQKGVVFAEVSAIENLEEYSDIF